MSTLSTNNITNTDDTPIASFDSDTMLLAPGSATRPPIVFQAGPSLDTPQAGAVEYNGVTFYTTPDAISGKAFNASQHFYSLAADRTLIATVVASTFYSAFGVGLPVAANSKYVVDILIGMRTGTTSHTVSFRFGGTATFGNCQYRTEFTNLALSTGAAAPGTPTAAGTLMFTSNPATAANAVISPASVLATKFFRIHGIISVTTGGTINPQIAFSANPGGTNQVTRLSYVALNAIGTSDGNLIAGNWA